MRKALKKKIHQDLAKATDRESKTPSHLEKSQTFSTQNRQDWIQLAVVVAAAFLLRLLFFYLNHKNNPAFNFPIMDSLYHHEWAKDIVSGDFWGNEIFFRGPLYPYSLALLYKLSGSSISFAVLCQHILGSFSCGLTYLLAREYFTRHISLLSGLFAALYWTFIFFEGELLIVTHAIFLDLLCLFLLARSIKRRSFFYMIAGGFVLGLSAIARPSILAFVPVIPIVYYLNRDAGKGGRRRFFSNWAGRSSIVIASALIVILPVLVRNYIVGKAIVPIASSGGVNFYIGNNPTSDGRTAIVPGTKAPWWGGNDEAIAIAERNVGKKLNPAEVSSYYFHRGLDFFVSHPGQAAKLLLKKFQMFWSAEERSNDKFIYFFWSLAGMRRAPLPGFWLIAPLAVLGGVLLWRRKRELSLLYLFFLAYMLSVVVFFVNARFRLPVVPIMIVFASYAVLNLINTVRMNRRRLLKSILILLPAVFFVNFEYPSFLKSRGKHNTISYYTLGSAYLQMGRSDDAIAQYEIARNNFKKFPTPSYALVSHDVNCKLGTLYWQKNDCDKTIEVLNNVRGNDEKTLIVRGFLGECYLKKNQLTNAYNVFTDILKVRPTDAPALTGLAQVYDAVGKLEEAESILESVLNRSGETYLPAYPLLAGIQHKLGKLDAAVQSYSKTAQFRGFERDAYLALSDIYIEKGDPDNALRMLERARRYFPPNDSTVEKRIAAIRDKR